MPFYDYKCGSCGKKFEVQKGMNDKTIPRCPACQELAMRVFSAPALFGTSSSCGSCSSGNCSTGCGGQ
ncbi:MAG: zinc ribbon domain-containing protein [Candidatus Margulisbacteria bacterium]|nr:zinc ribbon domain-containing protein [Candidatus Margulisiibacteriota bacterium]MBU1617597.1 zinc ribbon domain-containing protein [Candidatus Margulisiibacteriota bacterium]MBU1867140.1 zinc ribbon domain-containing protein [Candidatus Margulisiibacteriota bacterium]